jgi:methylenetetrahydrofolate dehydrogenase (NADP+) / methenyltetrahydrofolate cyclohydrolase
MIGGRAIARDLKTDVAHEVQRLRDDGLSCGLAVMMTGETYSSGAYERRLGRLARELDVPTGSARSRRRAARPSCYSCCTS